MMLPDVPKALVEAALRQRLTILVGAGASSKSGLPLWPNLVLALLKEALPIAPSNLIADIERKIGRLERSLANNEKPEDLLNSASMAKVALGESQFANVLIKQFESSDPVPSDIHRALARLGRVSWVTTNYDDLLERAIEDATGRRLDVVLPEDAESLLAFSENGILKVHGDLKSPSSIVLTLSDYAGMSYGRGTAWRERFKALITPPSQLLLIGYGYGDSDIQHVLQELCGAYGNGTVRPFWLEVENGDAFVRAKELSLQPVWLKSYDDVSTFLDQLAAEIERQRPVPRLQYMEAMSVVSGALEEDFSAAKALADLYDWASASEAYSTIIRRSRELLANPPEVPPIRRALYRAILAKASCLLNLQDQAGCAALLSELKREELDRELCVSLALNKLACGQPADAEVALKFIDERNLPVVDDRPEVREREHRARVFLDLRRGVLPDLATETDPSIRLETAIHILQEGRVSDAADVALGLVGSLGPKNVAFNARCMEVLVVTLEATLVQNPMNKQLLSSGQMPPIMQAIESVLTLTTDVMPLGLRAVVETLAAKYYWLVGDNNLLSRSLKWLETNASNRMPIEPAPGPVVEAIRKGQMAEAESLMPLSVGDLHAAVMRFTIYISAERSDLALDVMRDALRKAPASPLLARLLSLELAKREEWEEAAGVSSQALLGLPCRQSRELRALALYNTGKFDEAWQITSDPADWETWLDEGHPERVRAINLLRLRANIAIQAGRYNAGFHAWKRVLDTTSPSISDRCLCAQACFLAGDSEKAADLAAHALSGLTSQDSLPSVAELGGCAQLLNQYVHEDFARKALRNLVEYLTSKGALEPNYELIRFNVIGTLGSAASFPPPDVESLVKAGRLVRATNDQVVAMARQRVRQNAFWIERYRTGAISFDGLCTRLQSPAIEVFEELLTNAPATVAPIVGHVDVVAESGVEELKGKTLLFDVLSLLLLQKINGLEVLDEAIGQTGRIALRLSDWQRLTNDDASLAISVNRNAAAAAEEFRSGLAATCEIHRPTGSIAAQEESDSEVAGRVMAKVVTASPSTNTVALGELAMSLVQVGRLDRRKAVLLGAQMTGPASPLPTAVVLSAGVISALVENGAIDALRRASVRVHIGPRSWLQINQETERLRSEVARLDGLVRLRRWVSAREPEGRLILLGDVALPKLPELRRPSSDAAAFLQVELSNLCSVPLSAQDPRVDVAVLTDGLSAALGRGRPMWAGLAEFRWTTMEQLRDFKDMAGVAAAKQVSIVGLIDTLWSDSEVALEKRETLLAFGLSSALSSTVFRSMQDQYGSLVTGRPAEILSRGEWRMRSVLLDRQFASVAWGDSAADAVWATLTDGGDPQPLLKGLLDRAEALSIAGLPGVSAWFLRALFLKYSKKLSISFRESSESPGMVVLDKGKPGDRVWMEVHAWSTESDTNASVKNRAFRESTLSVVRHYRDSPVFDASMAALMLVADFADKSQAGIDFRDPVVEVLAALSGTWPVRPLESLGLIIGPNDEHVTLEGVLNLAVKAFVDAVVAGQPPDGVRCDGRFVDFPVPYREGILRVQFPQEAALQRAGLSSRAAIATFLSKAQGVHDAGLSAQLDEIARRPSQDALVESYIQASIIAPYRSVRDDIGCLAGWGSDKLDLTAPSDIDSVRNFLGEPAAAQRTTWREIVHRFQSGWGSVSYPGLLFDSLVALPGALGVHRAGIYRLGGPDHVEDALLKLKYPSDLSAGQLASNLALIRLKEVRRIAEAPQEGEPVRQFPDALVRVLASLSDERSPSTLAGAEAALLRLCWATVSRLGGPAAPPDLEWIAWHLATWVLKQIEMLSPERQASAFETIFRLAPSSVPTSDVDILHPARVDSAHHDLRAAAVLWSLLQAEGFIYRSDDETAPPAGLSEAAMALLVSLVERPLTAAESNERYRSREDSVLGFGPLIAVPDLALNLLLLYDSSAIRRLSVEKRVSVLTDLFGAPEGLHWGSVAHLYCVAMAQQWKEQSADGQRLLLGGVLGDSSVLSPVSRFLCRFQIWANEGLEREPVVQYLCQNVREQWALVVAGPMFQQVATRTPNELSTIVKRVVAAAEAHTGAGVTYLLKAEQAAVSEEATAVLVGLTDELFATDGQVIEMRTRLMAKAA